MKTHFRATITNHGVKVGEHTYTYGVPQDYFPRPHVPGSMYKVTVEFIGTDPEMKPQLHAYWPNSSFGGICKNEGELRKMVREARSALRNMKNVQEKRWWKARLEKLKKDLKLAAQARINFAAAVRYWKKHKSND